MPIVTVNGQRYSVDNTNPDTIQKAIDERKRRSFSSNSSSSVVGDIGRGIAAGAVSIPQGLITLPTTGIDLLFDTDVTDDINDFFDDIKPDVEGTAGKTAQMVTQFGVPGLGVASALSKLTKVKQLGSLAAIDAAVATDDVDTFADMIFDKESDEERLKNLQGRDAALARLTERLQVFGETATVMYAAPKIVGGAVKGVGAGLDLAAPYIGALAKASAAPIKKYAALADVKLADKKAYQYLKRNFTYGGTYEQTAANNKVIADVMQAKMLYVSGVVNPINDSFNSIKKTLQSAVSNGGKMNTDDALKLTKAMATYRAPLLAVERDFPLLKGGKGSLKERKMNQYQNDAMKTIKSFEGSGNKIDYEALGVDSNNVISNIMEKNKGLYELEQDLIIDYSKSAEGLVTKLVIPEPVREAIKDNVGKYGTTIYRAIVDQSYVVPKELKDAAIQEIRKIPGLEDFSNASAAFKELTELGNVPVDGISPKAFVDGLKFGSLKGKTLKDLPAVRKAMGEVTALDYTKADSWKKAFQDEAYAATKTMSVLGSLAGKAKAFDEIRTLSDTAVASGRTSFLKTTKELFPDGKIPDQLPPTYTSPVDGVEYIRFTDDKAGALKDTYAPQILHDTLLPTTKDYFKDLPDILENTYRGLVGLKAIGQYGKTILGPTAQIRNITSVAPMALMNGNLGPSSSFFKNFKMAFAGVFNPGKKAEYLKEIKEATDYGLMVGRGTQLQEIADIATVATSDGQLLSKLKSKPLFDVMTRIKEGPLGIAERAYTGSDNAARQINWTGERYKLGNVIAKSTDDTMIPVVAGRNIADPDIQKLIRPDGTVNVGELKAAGDNVLDKFIKGEAADIALNVTPTYSRVPQMVKTLKYVPVVGNFTAFPAEIIRNTVNTLERGIKELASNSAELQKVGARRITGAFTTTVGLPVGLTATALAMTGADKEQLEAYKRSFAAPWEKTATMIPTSTDANGNITGLYNFSYTNPYDFLQRPAKAVLNAFAEGDRNEASLMKKLNDATYNSVVEFVSPFVSTSMGVKAVAEAFDGKTETGKLIFNESDPGGDQIAKGLMHTFNAISPTILPFTFQTDAEGTQIVPKDFITAVASVATGKKGVISPRGKPIDAAETITSAFSGIKVIKPQIDRALYYKAAEAKRAIRETTNEYNRLLRSSNKRDAQDFIQGYINTNEARYNSLRTLYTAIEDARTLGLDEFEIDEQLKVAKVANRDMVMQGLFNPIEVNEDILNLALQGTERKAAQPVPVGDIALAQADLTGQSLQGQFIDPSVQSNRPSATRASDVLRQEELNKILTGKP